MLRIIEFDLHLPEGARVSSSMGSIMQGALMELVGNDTANKLHEMALRPYSQCIYYDVKKKKAIWRICTLSDSAYQKIVKPVLFHRGNIYLKQKNYEIVLESHADKCIAYDELVKNIFSEQPVPKGVEVEFFTTTSFRHGGRYELIPKFSLIFHSLLQRWNLFSPILPMEQEDLEQMFAKECYLSRYHLQSLPYSIEGKMVYGFQGELGIKFHKNEMANRLMAVLMSFAPYSGIGIKTAMGMGAVTIRLIY